MNSADPWELPNPFISQDGVELTGVDSWPAHVEHLKRLLSERFYGEAPPAPPSTFGQLIEREFGIHDVLVETYRLHTGHRHNIHFNVHVARPSTASRETIPIVVARPELPTPEICATAVRRGFALACFEIGEAAPDDMDAFASGSAPRAYPDYTWRAFRVWAWLQSRVIDWLETTDFADASRPVVSGHSRFGKTALCCGIYDARVQVVAPIASGCGGMASMRLNGSRLGEGIGVAERIGGMTRMFPHWLLDSVAEYGEESGVERYRENELPFDANIMASCIAPRGLVLAEGLDDLWINPYGTQVAWLATTQVYSWLGAAERCAIHYREGGHEFAAEDWDVVFDFANVTLRGTPKETRYKTFGTVLGIHDPIAGFSWRAPGRGCH